MDRHSFRLRSSHRFQVTYPVIFAGAPFVGEGTVCSFSRAGCSIRCHRSVLAGSFLQLGVLLPDLEPALLFELGRVRWVNEHSFGVEFIRLPRFARHPLDQAAWERLAALLERRAQRRQTPVPEYRLVSERISVPRRT
jgi:hypothetical protein